MSTVPFSLIPPPIQWEAQDYLGISERYRKQVVDRALFRLLILFGATYDRGDRIETIAGAGIVPYIALADTVSQNKHSSSAKVLSCTVIRGRTFDVATQNTRTVEERQKILQDHYLSPLTDHLRNVDLWQKKRLKVIQERWGMLSPLIRLVGWVARLCLGIAAKERAVFYAHDRSHMFDKNSIDKVIAHFEQFHCRQHIEISTDVRAEIIKRLSVSPSYGIDFDLGKIHIEIEKGPIFWKIKTIEETKNRREKYLGNGRSTAYTGSNSEEREVVQQIVYELSGEVMSVMSFKDPSPNWSWLSREALENKVADKRWLTPSIEHFFNAK